jgi:hypothetical protein
MNNVIFGKLNDGRLIALDAETKEPILSSTGGMMSPLEYYESVGHPVTDWSTSEKVDFIRNYGGGEYKNLRAGHRRNKTVKYWTVEEKTEYISKYGKDAYMELSRHNR